MMQQYCLQPWELTTGFSNAVLRTDDGKNTDSTSKYGSFDCITLTVL